MTKVLLDWNREFKNFVHHNQNTNNAMIVESEIVGTSLATKLMKVKQKTDNVESSHNKTPMQRMQDCRDGLAILDRRGWNRSFHQRLFHEDFLVSFVLLSIVFGLGFQSGVCTASFAQMTPFPDTFCSAWGS